MKKIVVRVLLGIAAVALIVYVVDYTLLRYRMLRNLAPYDTVTVRYYYQVQEKNNRTEYAFASAQPEKCVNSLYPHQALEPCWYARRHAERPIKI
jgi:hypothetical protein